MSYTNPFFPYGFGQTFQQPTVQQPQLQPQQVVRVNGENGARAFQIGANSSAMLLDESGTMIWLVTSDGAGYKTVTPYDIAPHQQVPAPDYGDLENRIRKLEERINGNTGNHTANHEKQSDAGKD